MSLPLPDPIAAYFRAQNAHDVDGMLGAFASVRSTVRDEGQRHDRLGPPFALGSMTPRASTARRSLRSTSNRRTIAAS